MHLRDQKGFSLVEIIVVVSILAIVSAIAIPSLIRYVSNSNLKSAARDVASDILNLRERSIAENRMYKISISVADNNYTIDQCNATGSSCAAYTAIETKSPTAFGTGITITGNTYTGNAITFQTRGTAEAGSISLTNSRGSTATITSNITGKAYVKYTMQ